MQNKTENLLNEAKIIIQSSLTTTQSYSATMRLYKISLKLSEPTVGLKMMKAFFSLLKQAENQTSVKENKEIYQRIQAEFEQRSELYLENIYISNKVNTP
jgi:hypothetical protein